jgi:chemotaxis protein MotA
MMLVLFGTIGAAMAGGLLKDTTGSIKWLKMALTAKPTTADGLVEDLVKLADRARREGLLALEDAASRHPEFGFLGQLGTAVHVLARR